VTETAIAPPAPPADPAPAPGRSWAWRLVRLATRRRAAVVGLVLLTTIVAIALAAPLLAPSGGEHQVGPPFGAPSAAHPLGLSDQGVDMVAAMIWATRVSLLVGFSAALISLLVGGVVGIAAGYFGGWVDLVLTLVTDYFIVIPALPLLIVISAVWGASLLHVVLIIGLLIWTTTARVVRAQVMTLRERTFVRRARALGAGRMHVVVRHILPHVAPLLVANAVLAVASAIFAETALSFLGLGDPTQASLGRLIQQAYDRAAVSAGAWWAILTPGVAVALIVLSASLIGLALEESLNPRQSHVPFLFRLVPPRWLPASRTRRGRP
jgi:peptide/nickel transport system permease protein